MCIETVKFEKEPQSKEHVFSTRNTDTIAIKTRKGSQQSYFCENTTKLINIYFAYYFVNSFIAFFRISLQFIDFAYKLLKL